MGYIIKPHARARMEGFGISEELVLIALETPDQVVDDKIFSNRLVFKKLFNRNGKNYLLLVVAEMSNNRFEVITVIKTSKIRKYLQ